jgi:hypothetical protein
MCGTFERASVLNQSCFHYSSAWNVGFVAFFYLVWVWIAKASVLEQAHNECMGSMAKFMWITPLWIVVAFISVVVDERMGDSGTERERQPINV